jgi:glutaminyl-peptide cyclotransferase
MVDGESSASENLRAQIKCGCPAGVGVFEATTEDHSLLRSATETPKQPFPVTDWQGGRLRLRVFFWLCGLLALAVGLFHSNDHFGQASKAPAALDANRAFAHVQKLVSFGPRPPGSPGIAQAQSYISTHLKRLSLQVECQDFMAATPLGAIGMKNIIARLPGESDRLLILGSHYDTKPIPGTLFVGANDGGSSTGLLLELARVLAQKKRNDTLWFVFFDGEEAQREWTEQDSLYGSRHFVERLREQRLIGRVKAMVLMDMIGDNELELEKDQASTSWLVDLLWKSAQELGYGKHLASSPKAMVDDHIPFIEAGIPAVDIIDFNFGLFNRHWHNTGDTLDKVGPQSLKITGEIVLRLVDKLSAK